MSDRGGRAAGIGGPADEAQEPSAQPPRTRHAAGASATWARTWRWIILAGAGSTALMAALALSGPPRALVTLAFMSVCPGMSLARLIDLGDALAEVALAIAMSVALAGLVGGTLLYFNLWSPGTGSALLVAIAVGGVAADLLKERHGLHVHVRGTVSPDVGAVSASTSGLTTPAGGVDHRAEALVAVRASAEATLPRPHAQESTAPPRDAPTEDPPVPLHWHHRGETAPGFLLETPTGVVKVADDFFDGLVRRVERDR
jgi:hypothetical protein